MWVHIRILSCLPVVYACVFLQVCVWAPANMSHTHTCRLCCEHCMRMHICMHACLRASLCIVCFAHMCLHISWYVRLCLFQLVGASHNMVKYVCSDMGAHVYMGRYVYVQMHVDGLCSHEGRLESARNQRRRAGGSAEKEVPADRVWVGAQQRPTCRSIVSVRLSRPMLCLPKHPPISNLPDVSRPAPGEFRSMSTGLGHLRPTFVRLRPVRCESGCKSRVGLGRCQSDIWPHSAESVLGWSILRGLRSRWPRIPFHSAALSRIAPRFGRSLVFELASRVGRSPPNRLCLVQDGSQAFRIQELRVFTDPCRPIRLPCFSAFPP